MLLESQVKSFQGHIIFILLKSEEVAVRSTTDTFKNSFAFVCTKEDYLYEKMHSEFQIADLQMIHRYTL